MWINQHILNLDINTHPRWVMSLDAEQYFHLETRKEKNFSHSHYHELQIVEKSGNNVIS